MEQRNDRNLMWQIGNGEKGTMNSNFRILVKRLDTGLKDQN